MLSIPYDVIVQPLVYLIEFVFGAFHALTHNPGVAIVGVSIVVNVLCLPLYRMADDQQARERAKQQKMARWVSHIKRTFSGDEQYMMLSAYYTEQGYRPVQALVGSLTLLLQIPFFMAAYAYLSNLTLLHGASFLFLSDLGSPDGLLRVGGLAVNVLPVAMTLLNCASTFVYTKGLPLRDKLQAYLLAAVFLVLLYDSPSGLVFYWTCNQLFSLGKNLVMKADPERSAHRDTSLGPVRRRRLTMEFLAACALLTGLLGLFVPSSVIAVSPTEFIVSQVSENPFVHVLHTTCVWAGVLFLWVGIYFFLSGDKVRERFVLVLWCLAGACALNFFAFGQGLGTITNTLRFDHAPDYGWEREAVNILAIAAVVTLLAIVWRWRRGLVRPVLVVCAAAVCVAGLFNVVSSWGTIVERQGQMAVHDQSFFQADGKPRKLFHLSRDSRNVVVVFLDRALSGYVPYIMHERPDLQRQFDGFTYYPNALSYGQFTNYGAPALYGGYDYTPDAMDARTDRSVPQKHDEAMLLMPTLFSKVGMRSTVVDPPYAGSYKWIADLSLYDDLDNVEAVDVQGAFAPVVEKRLGVSTKMNMDRQYFCYSLFKVLPECAQGPFYDKGHYQDTDKSDHLRAVFMNAYSVLELMPELTQVGDGPGGFVLMCNLTAHEPDMLQLPDYRPVTVVHNEGLEDMGRFTLNGSTVLMDNDERLSHYHVNMAALMELGKWFDWLRAQGTYDNTRIIVVSDHGRPLGQWPELIKDEHVDVEGFNPLLMAKDFDAHGFSTSHEFMTNADVPHMALRDVVDDPHNPFTGNAVDDHEKRAHEQRVTTSWHFNPWENNGQTYDTSDNPWYAVHDDIFDLNNWKRLD